MLGFLVRECVVALGHAPTPEELAAWANGCRDERGPFCLFGRAITPAEARVILRHPGREVTVRAERFLKERAGGRPSQAEPPSTGEPSAGDTNEARRSQPDAPTPGDRATDV